MRPDPIELVLPPSLDPARAVELLGERLALVPGRPSSSDRVLLDTFDGRLRSAGLRAEAAGGELVLFEPGAPVRRATVKPGARRYLLDELPEGVVRDRLAGVLGVRALLPRAQVRTAVQPLAMVDSEEKTVARLAIERCAVEGGGELAPRLEIRPVLGYDKAFARAARAADGLGFGAAGVTLFDAAVSAAGGRPSGARSKPQVELDGAMRSDEAAGLVLSALAEIAAANVQGTIDDLDSEFLHDLRVSVRRARSVLREIQGVHPVAARAALRDELRWAQAITGPVRDLDVQLLGWASLTAEIARPDDLLALRAVLARRRDAEQVKLRRALRTRRFAALLEAWRALAATPPPAGEDPSRPSAGTPIRTLARGRIRKVHKAIIRDGTAIGPASPDEALHDLRKRCKELRYLLELFGGPFDPAVVKPLVTQLKGLQDVLGRFQDGTVHVAFLRGLAEDLAGEPDGPAALIALGSVLDAVAADKRVAREEFAEAFTAFAAAKRP